MLEVTLYVGSVIWTSHQPHKLSLVIIGKPKLWVLLFKSISSEKDIPVGFPP